MKKAKLIKDKKQEQKQIQNDTYSIKSFILIIVVISVIFGIFYLVTSMFVKPVKEESYTNEITEFDSTKITLGNLLDRKENEYYVLATMKSLYNSYTSKINYSELYNNYISSYTSNEDSMKFYYVDLDDALNKNYISEELNISNEISELKLNNEVLFKIKNKEIEDYYVGSSDILLVLKELND